MQDRGVSVKVQKTCGFCGSRNVLTVRNVLSHEQVLCSRCGAPLGRLGELKREAAEELSEPIEPGRGRD